MTHAEPRANPRSPVLQRNVPTLWIAACYAPLLTWLAKRILTQQFSTPKLLLK
jgi:hypothetical protein